MDEDIDLPSIPLPRVEASQEHLPTSGTRRKRPRLEDDEDTTKFTLSSDPALFSSDDHSSGIENYAAKRRKQQWEGTWWGEGRDVAPKRKRSFKRNLDSGIFLGSESTDSGLEDEFLADVLPQSGHGMEARGFDHRNLQRDIHTSYDAGSLTDQDASFHHDANNLHQRDVPCLARQPVYTGAHMPPWPSSMSSHTDFNADSIRHAIEKGRDCIDLSGRNITELTADIRILDTLTHTNPIPALAPVSASSYTPFTPRIKLYLANNALTTLPMELYELQHLTVLSARHNQLATIYPLVGALQNLEELNLSFNGLKLLPYELLSLVRRGTLKRFYAFPNPFIAYEARDKLPNPRSCDARQPTKIAESVPSFFRPTASPYYPHENQIARRALLDNAPSSADDETRNVPSLFEQCLLSYSALYGAKELGGIFEDAGLSEKARIAEKFVRGRERCSVCGDRRVIMRVEWIEWYELGQSVSQSRDAEDSGTGENENAVPFERAACSLACYVARTLGAE